MRGSAWTCPHGFQPEDSLRALITESSGRLERLARSILSLVDAFRTRFVTTRKARRPERRQLRSVSDTASGFGSSGHGYGFTRRRRQSCRGGQHRIPSGAHHAADCCSAPQPAVRRCEEHRVRPAARHVGGYVCLIRYPAAARECFVLPRLEYCACEHRMPEGLWRAALAARALTRE